MDAGCAPIPLERRLIRLHDEPLRARLAGARDRQVTGKTQRVQSDSLIYPLRRKIPVDEIRAVGRRHAFAAAGIGRRLGLGLGPNGAAYWIRTAFSPRAASMFSTESLPARWPAPTATKT